MSSKKQLVVIGAGPAGLAAAISAKKHGLEDILVLERDEYSGGILNQCIHNGFGLHTFNEELTGPEYAARFIDQAKDLGIEVRYSSMVIDLGSDRKVSYVNKDEGLVTVDAHAVILAMGCRERPRGALNIPGTRPAGIFSAGTAQKLVNIDGWMPGKNVVILGSGDIGLIMARRMVLEGAHVSCVVELMPCSSGLKRNIVQCLDDFNIPLMLSHTITDIKGKKRIESVTISAVDENRRPVPGSEIEVECDTLLLSCGLIPENELSIQAGIELDRVTGGPVVSNNYQTSVPGVFACGNVLHVHDLVDFVSSEAEAAGKKAAEFVLKPSNDSNNRIPITPEGLVRYTVPAYISPEHMDEFMTVRFRVANECRNGFIDVDLDGKRMIHKAKKIMAPGEMESIILKKEWLKDSPEKIVIRAGKPQEAEDVNA